MELLLIAYLFGSGLALGFCLGALYELRKGRRSLERLEAESEKIRQEWDALERDIRAGM